MNIFSSSLIKGLTFTLFLMLSATPAFAVAPAPYKVICHHTPAQDVTLSFLNEQSYNGHLGTPHSGEVHDTDGECEEATVTPTIEPTITSEPTPEVPEFGALTGLATLAISTGSYFMLKRKV